MLVVPVDGGELEKPEVLVNRLYGAKDFRVESVEPGEDAMEITIVCGEETFLMEMYPTDFALPELYRCQHFFPDLDIEAIQKVQYGLAVEMEFGENALDRKSVV